MVNNSPCFLVAKFLRNNLAQLETQAVCYFLRQVRMRATAEYFDIRHFVAVQGVVQSERAAAASGCRVWKTEKSQDNNWKLINSWRATLTELKCVPYLSTIMSHTSRMRLFLQQWRARFNLRRCRDDVTRKDAATTKPYASYIHGVHIKKSANER